MTYKVVRDGGVEIVETGEIVHPQRSRKAWGAYQAWLRAGNVPIPPDPMPPVVPEVARVDYRAAGEARAARKLKKMTRDERIDALLDGG